FLYTAPHPQKSTLFPYTTLFRSKARSQVIGQRRCKDESACFNADHGVDLRALEFSRQGVDRLSKTLRVFQQCRNVIKINAGLRKDRKSTRLNSSHRTISYAVFCL